MKKEHLDKIQKCLELSKSSNPHEAATALRMAQSLMKKYGLSQDDLDFVTLGKTMSSERIPKATDQYTTYLITSIARIYGVSAFLHNGQLQGKTNRKARFALYVGEKAPAALAGYTFDVVYRLLKKARREYAGTLSAHHPKVRRKMTKVFADHWIATVVEDIENDHIDKDTEAFHRKYLEQAMDHEIGKGKTFRDSEREYTLEEMIAGKAGQDAAKDVRIITPMDGSETPKLSQPTT